MKNNRSFGSLFPYLNIENCSYPMDWNSVFLNNNPIEIEIGFGTGEYLISMAQQRPMCNFIGFEQSSGRILATLRKIHMLGLKNIRIFRIDAIWAFQYYIAEQSIDAVHCLFPCPWPKKRHVKHRLFSKDFFALIATRLKEQGTLRIITDHHPYSQWMIEQLDQGPFSIKHQKVPPLYGTKFEKIWVNAGQELFDELILKKTNQPVLEKFKESKPITMKTFFIDRINPKKITFPSYSQDVAVEFREYIFDEQQQRGHIQAVVSEDMRTQYVWLAFFKNTKNGWTLVTMAGNNILPTRGVNIAMELVYQALKESSL